MEALSVDEVPIGDEWQYEPKWDGFRCLAFRDGAHVELQSKAGQPLARYFPEISAAIAALKPKQFVLDGELAIPSGGAFSFDDLLLRLHPAESRIRKLAAATPAIYIAFDLLADEKGRPLLEKRSPSGVPRSRSLPKPFSRDLICCACHPPPRKSAKRVIGSSVLAQPLMASSRSDAISPTARTNEPEC
jgi:hypothetical protein